ncbi:MAG: PD40 domain-containing protein, partial [Desulfobacterales bacterium]|nr:PD40 domain-containing protein [Desulfobacterales bacterium]
MKFRGWTCTVLAAATIAGVSLAAEAQLFVVDEDTAAEKIAEAVSTEGSESGGAAEIDEPGENRANETGEEPVLEEGKALVTGEEAPPAEGPPESVMAGKELETEVSKVIEPLWVRELTEIKAGHNDSNPVWSPSGELIAFERSIGDKKEIIIASPVGTIAQKVYLQLTADDDGMQFFLPGIFDEVSYNSGLSWSPGGDRFVVMSNGGGGNYDLYLGAIGSDETKRLTEHTAKDGLAHWSPVDDHLVFVSGRTGCGDIYLIDLATRALRRLTRGDKAYLFPQWSPDGKKIVMTYGSNDNHDIYLIGDVKEPLRTLKPLTTWPYDDLRPVWSPDGKKIAFYTNYNKEDDPKVWSLGVIAADGSDPTEGEGLAMKVVAVDIIPDVEQGPAWMPDSDRIVYVKNDRHAYNPIHIVDIEKRTNLLLRTGARMNHDVTCSVDGTIAFRAQVEQWDHIHVARMEDSERRFPSVDRTEYERDRSVLPYD